jgi:5-hydroxyisourate hydrolase-like protein (transthyretin family)
MMCVHLSARLAAIALLFLGISLPARAQVVETEPNSSCPAAHDLGTLAGLLTITGSLDTPPATPDVDFYRIAGTPGDLVQIDMQGQASSLGTLENPFLGAFNSACGLRGYIDDGGELYPESRMETVIPADGALVIGATSSYDATFTGQGGSAGSYTMTVRRVPLALGIGGRIVNGRTGQPVENAWVYLSRCQDGGCSGPGGSMVTGPDGAFRFAPGSYSLNESILRAGEYLLFVHVGPSYQQLNLRVQLAEGQDLDLGGVALGPVPVIGSIQGRIVDAQTGEALTGETLPGPLSAVELLFCAGDYCFPIRWASVDAQGRFVFQSSEYQMIEPGRYRVRAHADQYYVTDGPVFEVAEDQHLDAGDLPVKSYPVRLTLGKGCGLIPTEGGDCQIRVRVTNGGTGRLQSEVWALLRAYPPGFPGEITQFPLGNARTVNLAPAASADLPFSFHVPGSLEDGSTLCVRAYAADRPNPFKTIGIHDVLCFRKGMAGFTVLPDEEKHKLLKKTD